MIKPDKSWTKHIILYQLLIIIGLVLFCPPVFSESLPEADQITTPTSGAEQIIIDKQTVSTADEQGPRADENSDEPLYNDITGTAASPDEFADIPEEDSIDHQFDGFDGFDEFDEFDEFEFEENGETAKVFDPLNGYNRAMTVVNDRLYSWVLKPVARGYRFVMPKPVRLGIDNIFDNLGYPVRFVNNLLQLKVKQSGVETARFLMNSTVGVAGLWDPADKWLSLSSNDEDFGQTLGHYGMGSGFHIVLPLLGPSNARDACGRVADAFLNPVNYLDDEDTILIKAVGTVNRTSLHIGEYEAITKDALDLYILLRNGYEQNRENKIAN